MIRNLTRLGAISSFFIFNLFLYQNCGSQFELKENGDGSSNKDPSAPRQEKSLFDFPRTNTMARPTVRRLGAINDSSLAKNPGASLPQREQPQSEQKEKPVENTSNSGAPKTGVNSNGDSNTPSREPASVEDWFRYPFSKESAQWRPIGTGAQYSANSDPATQALIKTNPVQINHNNVYGAAASISSPNDPLVTIKWNGAHSGNGLPVTIRMAANEPFFDKDQGDRSFELLNPVTLLVDSFYGISRSKKEASIHKVYDIRGLGHGKKLGDRIAMSASGASSLLGALRAFEVQTPGLAIQHAHAMAVPRSPGHNTPLLLSKAIQWPACGGDSSSSRPDHNTGPIAYGALLAIPPVSKGGPDFDKMNPPLSEAGRRLFESFRRYGIYLIDGGQTAAFRADGPINQALVDKLKVDFKNHLFKNLRVVTNSVNGATASVKVGNSYSHQGNIGTPSYPAGGGEPLH